MQQLRKEFGGLVAVNDVDFVIPRKAIVGLIGPNGAGKTTFFNMLTGVYKPTAGLIEFDGTDITGKPPHQITKLGIGRTFQNIRLFQYMTALENVLVGMHQPPQGRHLRLDLRHRRASAREERESIDTGAGAARLLRAQGPRERRLRANLPYGDQRRLEVARALATEPKLLLLDEPTAGMNPQETAAFTEFASKLRDEQGLTVLLIEHDMKVVMGISDRVTVLDYGEKIAEGAPGRGPERRARDRGLSREGGDDRRGSVSESPTEPAQQPAAARSPRPSPRRRAQAGGNGAILEVDDIHTYYGAIHALKGITLEVREGEIVTLIGANGAGKSTTLRSINGLNHPREGHDPLPGRGHHERRAAQDRGTMGISQSPEGRQALPAHDRAREPRDGRVPASKDRSTYKEDLERVYTLFPRLKERKTQKAGTLSGGEQQMLAMGRALMAQPEAAHARRALDGPRADLRRADLRDRHRDQPAGHADPARRAERAHGARRREPRLRDGDGPHRPRPTRRARSPATSRSRRPTSAWTSPRPGTPRPRTRLASCRRR